jgi:trehalose 6-phosphate synthase/phosphatase
MFKALQGEAYTIKVNSGASAAQYTILSQQRVVPMLNSLVQPPAPDGAAKEVENQSTTWRFTNTTWV